MKRFTVILFLTCTATTSANDVPPQWAALAKAVQSAGGTISFADGKPSEINLYNGNNPLKGRGGKNKAVNDDWLKQLAGTTSLKKLNLSNCDITNAAMVHVGTLTGLEELNLTLTPVTDAGFVHFGKLTRLRRLGLASSKCTGEGFKHLNVRNLESVNFHYTPLNDAGLEAICNVGVTGRLWFAHAHFTDAGTVHLAKLTKLKILGMGSVEKASSGDSVAVLAKLPLVDLSLLDRQADRVGIAHAAKIKTLQKLDLGYAPTATDEELKLIASLPKLRELRLGGAKAVTDAGLMHLAGCRSLKKVTLQGLKGVTKAGVSTFRKSRPDIDLIVK